MIVFLIYLVLSVITIYNIAVSIYVLRKTSCLFLLFPSWIIYYWSLYGIWSWVPLKMGGDINYLETELQPINIDEYYLIATVFYSLFLFVFNLFVIHRLSKYGDDLKKQKHLIKEHFFSFTQRLEKKSLYYVLLFALFLLVFKFSIEDIRASFLSGVSAYELSRFNSEEASFTSIKQLFSDLFIWLSVPLFFTRKKTHILLFILLIISFSAFLGINIIMGNRNTLLTAILMLVMLYVELNSFKSAFKPKVIFPIILVFFLVLSTTYIRSYSVEEILNGEFSLDILAVFGTTTTSVEKYSAQVSMYISLKNHIPFTYGSSILFFISSFIPSVFRVPRWEDIYSIYISHVNIIIQKGFAINHITAWYLNFGIVGVLLGAIFWGMILRYLFVKYAIRHSPMYLYAFALFSVSSIQMIRGGGLETYKASLVFTVLLPCLILYLFVYVKFKINVDTKFK